MALDNNTVLNYTDKTTIKNWFKTGLKPTQTQFWSTWDSFWHKSETLPISSINGLGDLIDGKAETEHTHSEYAKNDATSLTAQNITQWQNKLGINDLDYVVLPTEDATVESHPYVVVINDEGKSARRNATDFGKVDTVNSKEPDENKNVDLGLQDVMEVNRLINNMIQMESGGGLMLETNNEGLFGKRFFAYTSSEDPNSFRLGTGIYQPTGGWAAATFFGFGAMNSLLRENTTSQVSGIVAIGYNSLKGFERGINGGITAVGTETLLKFKGEPEILLASSHFMTAIGVNALREFESGSRNTVLGGSAGRNLKTGSNNTMVGASNLQSLVEGSNNTTMGYQTSVSLPKGSNNTLIGANLKIGTGVTELNDTIMIATGDGTAHIHSHPSTGTVIPLQTVDKINADTTGKAVITKEYLNSKYIISTDTTFPTLAAFKTQYPNLKVGDAVFYPNLTDTVQKKIIYLGNDIYVEEIINKLS